jgi:hypothetical protein
VITADGVPVPFRSPDEDAKRLVTSAPLAPDEIVAYDGSIYLPSETPLDAVKLIVAADSCDAKGATADDCPVKDAKPANNSYPLQAADIVVSKLELQPPLAQTFTRELVLSAVTVPVSFDVANTGHEPTGDFWIAAHTGQTLGLPQLDGIETDVESRLAHVAGLEPGGTLHVTGAIAIPRTSVGLAMVIEAGCPAGSGPCAVPEIEFDNNVAVGSIPIPPTPPPVGFTKGGRHDG